MEDWIDARMKLSEGDPNRLTKEDAQRLKAKEVGDVPEPPKYKLSDFQKSSYWRLRGKLDVPKERFISYPGCEREADPTMVVTWAGWNHLGHAKALGAYYVQMRDQEGWVPERLVPLLAGIVELLPRLRQWHNEVDAEYRVRMGEFLELRMSLERILALLNFLEVGPIRVIEHVDLVATRKHAALLLLDQRIVVGPLDVEICLLVNENLLFRWTFFRNGLGARSTPVGFLVPSQPIRVRLDRPRVGPLLTDELDYFAKWSFVGDPGHEHVYLRVAGKPADGKIAGPDKSTGLVTV
jgi:hypothetical protein